MFIFCIRGLQISTCLLVRHLSPDDEVVIENGKSNGSAAAGDSDSGDHVSDTAKRPCRQLKVSYSTWITCYYIHAYCRAGCIKSRHIFALCCNMLCYRCETSKVNFHGKLQRKVVGLCNYLGKCWRRTAGQYCEMR